MNGDEFYMIISSIVVYIFQCALKDLIAITISWGGSSVPQGAKFADLCLLSSLSLPY